MKTTKLSHTEAFDIMRKNKIIKGMARSNFEFDGYVTLPPYAKEAKRALVHHNTYYVPYVATQEDLEAKDWYLILE